MIHVIVKLESARGGLFQCAGTPLSLCRKKREKPQPCPINSQLNRVVKCRFEQRVRRSQSRRNAERFIASQGSRISNNLGLDRNCDLSISEVNSSMYLRNRGFHYKSTGRRSLPTLFLDSWSPKNSESARKYFCPPGSVVLKPRPAEPILVARGVVFPLF